jgi:hypothetical protein
VAFATMIEGVLMFISRNRILDVNLRLVPISIQYEAERSFLIAAVVITAIGLILLERHLKQAGDESMARTEATIYLLAAPLALGVESLEVAETRDVYPLYVVYLVLSLTTALIGGVLTRTKVLPAWIGWLSLIWGVGWQVALLILSPQDAYYPIIYHVMPLVIGIALLMTKRST